mmetsp:Transcript_7743/g.23004  ORF Transcript_7743/g.23004 Transcript_7743/m.23004 type:complete len:90 (-) Transcript_7743:1315-1584(-)
MACNIKTAGSFFNYAKQVQSIALAYVALVLLVLKFLWCTLCLKLQARLRPKTKPCFRLGQQHSLAFPRFEYCRMPQCRAYNVHLQMLKS